MNYETQEKRINSFRVGSVLLFDKQSFSREREKKTWKKSCGNFLLSDCFMLFSRDNRKKNLKPRENNSS